MMSGSRWIGIVRPASSSSIEQLLITALLHFKTLRDLQFRVETGPRICVRMMTARDRA
ncbi:hypothetical protein AAMO2058_001717400 [Amorphochlora amoebiformis]